MKDQNLNQKPSLSNPDLSTSELYLKEDVKKFTDLNMPKINFQIQSEKLLFEIILKMNQKINDLIKKEKLLKSQINKKEEKIVNSKQTLFIKQTHLKVINSKKENISFDYKKEEKTISEKNEKIGKNFKIELNRKDLEIVQLKNALENKINNKKNCFVISQLRNKSSPEKKMEFNIYFALKEEINQFLKEIFLELKKVIQLRISFLKENLDKIDDESLLFDIDEMEDRINKEINMDFRIFLEDFKKIVNFITKFELNFIVALKNFNESKTRIFKMKENVLKKKLPEIRERKDLYFLIDYYEELAFRYNQMNKNYEELLNIKISESDFIANFRVDIINRLKNNIFKLNQDISCYRESFKKIDRFIGNKELEISDKTLKIN